MNGRLALITGIGFGAGLMYLLDPAMGRRRRALARDKTVHAWKKTSDAVEATARDVTNRAVGLSQKLRSSFTSQEPPSDAVLVERVRSRMGHVVSHPHAIDVTASGGQIILRGPVFAAEVGRLLSSIAGVPGVDGVENRLEVHETAENVPALQGGIEPGGRFLQRIWSPSTTALITASGGALAFYGWNRRDRLGMTCRKLGLGMLSRGWFESRRRRSWIKNLPFMK
jgi:BON domain